MRASIPTPSALKTVGAVLVVGGGVAGVQAALDLTELGLKVYLVEKSGAIGGVMARLDKTFPTNDCSLCILAPKLVEAGRDPNIEILTKSELISLDGVPGNFTARIRKEPRYIDEEICTGCGQCTLYCLKQIDDDYNENLGISNAAHIDYAQAVPTSYYIDAKACFMLNYQTCGLCAVACQAKAIRFDQKEEILDLAIGSVILAPGFGRTSKEVLGRYGWGKFADVLSAFEHERLMCASGPTGGAILRPSDKKHPKKIAFIQCIGSRDQNCGNNYCSSVCCMYAIKQATLAREHDPSAEITLFYMDIRTHGKGFDAARERATLENNFRVIYARPPQVEDVFDGRLLLTWATEDGKHHYEKFDMVVLTQGLESPDDAEQLGQAAGIDLNSYLFAQTNNYTPLATSRPGVYVIGAFQGPKDIPDSVTQAGGAAALCSGQLVTARGMEITKAVFPEERDISREEPRIGVFVCHCGINIAGVVDVRAVRDYARDLPGVVYSTDNLYSCSQDTQQHLVNIIREHRLNRIVVSACTPRTHEPLFQTTLRDAGLNRALFEMANIRDQCSWVHMHEPEAATAKAKDLVRMAVAKAAHLTALPEQRLPVTPSALVIGGGLAGMTAALTIAEQGFLTTLVEQEDTLGGATLLLSADRFGGDPRKTIADLVHKVKTHSRIHVYSGATVASVSGYVGNFTTTITRKAGSEVVNHGIMVIATGGKPYKPEQYLYGQSERVLTQLELEQRLASGRPLSAKTKQVVMIQCVGSRGADLAYCSRVCCGQALKNAIRLKTINPDLTIFVFYRDMRAYGFMEDDYRRARELGVIFIRYSPDNPPKVTPGRSKSSPLKVVGYDPLLGEEVELDTDLLVLSVGIVPEDPSILSRMLKVPVTADKFYLEAHVKLRPVDMAVDGIFVCGLAHAPKSMDETIAQAQAAAGRACHPLANGSISPEPIVSHVDPYLCIGCGACETFCPYKAITINKEVKPRKAQTLTASCKGCGVCAARCPTMAIDMGRFTFDGIMAQVSAFGKSV
ncbi:tungsten-dependent benzoyl-CoA reductase-related protein bamE [Desulfocapsa sulfexigens DSM 10523]|uniref:Tungsten-dependent benzoyl-CoA reductase-related protein bamE n=1 Tax=Desulfocapsa sulfexigens (strain DSM 10523 / SB164P1) TaxID=1167006 RepID=M1PCY5_DESSD|nr:FAD-dependent oxidoreductase [Desulfocapsa sulfexigens]AGF77615.1 tungsten-dependent benzoyl-CoA reductase-related protein bamE [Desulfocapsa sulfexigens DSM 10523]